MSRRTLQIAFISFLALLAMTVSVVQAQSGQNGPIQNGTDQNGLHLGQDKPNPKATPELDTAVLYGVGLLGSSGALGFVRRRRQRKDHTRDSGS